MNWHEALKERMAECGDDFKTKTCTLTDEELSISFDGGFGGTEGSAFTAWGEAYVYFPICYDGAEWVGYAPRNPSNESMRHQGGG